MQRIFALGAAAALFSASAAFAHPITEETTAVAGPEPTKVVVDPNVRPDFDLSHSVCPAGIDAPRDKWAQEPTVVQEGYLENLKKDAPVPKPVEHPEKRTAMYRKAHQHPSVVATLSPEPNRLATTGRDVHVNTSGGKYHNVKSRQVFSHSIIIPREEAEEKGYVPEKYTNPEGNTRHTNTPGPTK